MSERGFEDTRMRLHEPVVRRRDRNREEALELEVGLERVEANVVCSR